MSCTASDLPRASLNYVAGIEDGDPIALWPLLLVLLYMISWKMAFSNAVFWLDCLTGGVLLVCSVWRCMYIGGETICGQVLDAVAGSSSGILPESNAYHFTHFSTILWCTSVCFEGHSVILLGKRLRAMRGQHQGGQQCSIVNTTCLWAAGLGTAFMATVFVVHFTNIYIHQVHNNIHALYMYALAVTVVYIRITMNLMVNNIKLIIVIIFIITIFLIH